MSTHTKTMPEMEMDEQDAATQDAFKTFLPGTGWCWMKDGEVIEIIDDSTF